MNLLELEGYHKYETETLSQFLSKFVNSRPGHLMMSGEYGITLLIPGKDYVYKCWLEDQGYDQFIELAQKNQNNPWFPKLLSKVKKIPLFFKRPSDVDGHLSVIKMEKLTPLTTETDSLVVHLLNAAYAHPDDLRAELEKRKKEIVGKKIQIEPLKGQRAKEEVKFLKEPYRDEVHLLTASNII